MAQIFEIVKLTCKRCGHKWVPRGADVRVCPNPKCHSVHWDVKKKEKEVKQ